jgi:hypothetical protein
MITEATIDGKGKLTPQKVEISADLYSAFMDLYQGLLEANLALGYSPKTAHAMRRIKPHMPTKLGDTL